MSPQILVLAMVIGGIYLVGQPVVKGVKKAAHGVVHVATLGRK